MQIKEITYKNKLYIILSVLTLFVLLFLFNLLENMVIYDIDDLNSTYDSYPLWREENGRYVFNFLSRVFCLYIPKLFGIHLQNAINTFGVFIYGLILSFLFAVCAKFYFVKGKNLFCYVIFYIIAGITFFSFALDQGPTYSSLVTFQYGYALASACNLLFLSFVMSYILSNGEKYKDTNTKNYKYILFVILAFCAGNSTQIATYTIMISLALMSLIIFLKNKCSFSISKNILWNNITRKPIIAYLCGIFLMVACPGFWIEVSWRHAGSIQEVISLVPDFLQNYYDFIYCQYINIFKFIGILLIIVIIKDVIIKRKIKDIISDIIISISPMIGVNGYFFTLILAGKSFPSDPPLYWFIEPYYHFYYKMVICCVVVLLIGIMFKGIQNKLFKILLFIVSSIVFLFTIRFCYIENSIFVINKSIYKDKIDLYYKYTKELDNLRETVYIQDKIMLAAIYRKKDIRIYPDFNEKIIIDYPRYLKKIYNVNIEQDIEHTDKDDLFRYFKSLGGIFTEEELEKTNFKKLLNKDFVLNKNGDNGETDNNNTDIQ